jgi:hypothetical protein
MHIFSPFLIWVFKCELVMWLGTCDLVNPQFFLYLHLIHYTFCQICCTLYKRCVSLMWYYNFYLGHTVLYGSHNLYFIVEVYVPRICTYNIVQLLEFTVINENFFKKDVGNSYNWEMLVSIWCRIFCHPVTSKNTGNICINVTLRQVGATIVVKKQ